MGSALSSASGLGGAWGLGSRLCLGLGLGLGLGMGRTALGRGSGGAVHWEAWQGIRRSD